MDDKGSLIIEQIPRLRRYARALTGNQTLADDLVQDCLERAWSRFYLWRRGSNLRAWLFTILHNQYANMVRRERRRPTLVPLSDWGSERAVDPAQEAYVEIGSVAVAWTHPGKVEAPYTVCIASASNLTGLVKSSVECRRTGL